MQTINTVEVKLKMMYNKNMDKSFFEIAKFKWTREPKSFLITADKIEIITKPHTDLWQQPDKE